LDIGSKLGKMKKTPQSQGWIAFAGTGLILLIILASLLALTRHQLRKQVIQSHFHALHGSFNQILRNEMLHFLVDDLNFTTVKIAQESPLLNPGKKIEQAAVESLKIPQVYGVQAYDGQGVATGLATSLDRIDLPAEMIAEIHQQGWSLRYLDEETWGLSLLPEELDSEYIVEFQMMRPPLESSLNGIDRALFTQGTLLALAALVLLGMVFHKTIAQILTKEKQLAEKSKVLKETNRQLSQAYKSAGLGAMTGHLMHGLKSPLTHLQSISAELQQIHHQQRVPELLETVKVIQGQVQRALSAMQEFGDTDLKYSLSLQEFSQLLREHFQQTHKEASLEIEGSEISGIFLDNLQSHLSLAILSNLLQNSVDAKRNASIKLTMSVLKNELRVEVADDAGGISPHYEKFLFSPLVSTKPGGTGIGLALSFQLAESMGGRLEMTRNNQRGASFCLCLPVYRFEPDQ